MLELLSEGAENVLDLGKGDLAGTLLVEDLGGGGRRGECWNGRKGRRQGRRKGIEKIRWCDGYRSVQCCLPSLSRTFPSLLANIRCICIYLQAFDVVLLDSGGGEVGLDGGEDGLEVGEGDALDAESVSAASSEDGSVGHVAAQSAEDVA